MIKFIVLAHNDKNRLLRCLSSICSSSCREFSVDILYNYQYKEDFKNTLYVIQKNNKDITFKVKRYNIHIRDRYMSEDLLMLRKWVKKGNINKDDYIIICTEKCIIDSDYVQEIIRCPGYTDRLNIITHDNPLDEVYGNGGCIYKGLILNNIPNKQWRNLTDIYSLYKWCFAEFAQSKKFFENVIEAETNKKFYILKYNNVILD